MARARPVGKARSDRVVLNHRAAAAADMNAEVDVVHVVRFDAMVVAGDGDAGCFLRHVASTVAHSESTKHDAVAADRDDAADPAAVDHRARLADDLERAANDQRTGMNAGGNS